MVQQAKTMTAAEYAALPETSQPMELIHGEVIVSPAPRLSHQRLVAKIMGILISREGEAIVSPMDVYFDDDTVLQPDVFLVSADNESCRLEDDGHVYGAPDLVVEVLSPGTAVRDKTVKFDIYERHGVREYWLVEASYMEVWRLNEAGAFERVGVYEKGQTFTSSLVGDIDVGEIF